MATSPIATDLLWPDPERGPWWIHVSWRVQHGTLTPVGISLRSWVDREETRASGPHNHLPQADADVELPRVDGQLMRALPMGRIVDEARRRLIGLLNDDRDQSAWPESWRDAHAAWRAGTADLRDAGNSGRRGRDLGDDHYREVAEVYAAAVRAGEPPTEAVRKHFTVEKSTAAKKVARARERGFLPPTTRGRVGRVTEEL